MTGFRFTETFAFVMIDRDDDESLPAFTAPDGMMLPLFAGDRTRLDLLRPIAQAIATRTGKPITLVRFTTREDVERIEP